MSMQAQVHHHTRHCHIGSELDANMTQPGDQLADLPLFKTVVVSLAAHISEFTLMPPFQTVQLL